MATADVYSAVLALFKSESFELLWRIVVESDVRIILEKRAAAKLAQKPSADADVERKSESRRRCGRPPKTKIRNNDEEEEEEAAATGKQANSRLSYEDEADPAFPDGVDDPAFFEADPPSVGPPFIPPVVDEDWIKQESEADLADSGGEWGSGGSGSGGSGGSGEWDLLDPYVVPPAPPPSGPRLNPYVALRSIDLIIGEVDKLKAARRSSFFGATVNDSASDSGKKSKGDSRTLSIKDGDDGDDGDDYGGDDVDTFLPPLKIDHDVGARAPAAASGAKEEDSKTAPAAHLRRGSGKLNKSASRAAKKSKKPAGPASMKVRPSVGLASREKKREAENSGYLTKLASSSNSNPYVCNGATFSSDPVSSSAAAAASAALNVSVATSPLPAAAINSTALFATADSITTVSTTAASTNAGSTTAANPAASATSAIVAAPSDTASTTDCKRKYLKQPLPRARYGDRSKLKTKKIQRPIVKKPCPLCKKTNYGNKYLRTHIKRCHPRSLAKMLIS